MDDNNKTSEMALKQFYKFLYSIFVAIVLAIILVIALFWGEPDLLDSINNAISGAKECQN